MGTMNKDWHAKNAMPEKPTLLQRIAWHQEHAKHCSCRPIPAKILEEMKKSGIGLPGQRSD